MFSSLRPVGGVSCPRYRSRERRVICAVGKEDPLSAGIHRTTMATADSDIMRAYVLGDAQRIQEATEDFSSLEAVLGDVQGACDALPEAELKQYREAQLSVVNAKRSAETNEGLLQVC